MLPSRLHRNLGIPPPLRSLLLPHPSLPATLAVRIRFRLIDTLPGARPAITNSERTFTTSTRRSETALPSTSANTSESESTISQEPRMQITFTCTVDGCGRTRSTHQFTKRAYETGIVLIQCPGCKNRHLIADHLGWFKDSTEGGALRTIEDILGSKGENVKRGVLPSLLEPDKVVEFAPDK